MEQGGSVAVLICEVLPLEDILADKYEAPMGEQDFINFAHAQYVGESVDFLKQVSGLKACQDPEEA